MRLLCLLLVSSVLWSSCSGSDKRIQSTIEKLNNTLNNIDTPLITESALQDSLESVITRADLNEQLIQHTAFTTSYNDKTLTPNWVSYALTNDETQGTANRRSQFIPDPKVNGKSATTYDYSRTGWDRGHMAPAGDMKWSEQAMDESFYLSNICPQAKALNTGLWRVLEEKIRKWARQAGLVYIVCGPIYDKQPKTIGRNDVAIPTHFFKVLLRPVKGHRYEALGFIFPNEDCSGEIYNYAVSVDEVEQLTGHDFFHHLDDATEDKVEAALNTWK